MNKTLTAAERSTIMDACQSISRSADALKNCHTVDGDWGDDSDAKAFYDAEMQLLERLVALLAAHPGQPEPRAEVTDGWQPIETAQEGQLVVVGWLDPTDPEHPERHNFDWLEDGVWQQHFADYEHFTTCAPAGSTGPSEEAPYTHWMPIAEIPRAARAGDAS